MKRMFLIFGAGAVCFAAAFVVVGRTGAIDMKQKAEVTPSGAVPNGRAEKPIVNTTGIGPGETKR
ncbi:hypothetical protein JQ634_00965 [Bradyrhizobium sp. AUGA SZCCT0240]|uniref:hypothetical protein n=1 Tax=Bradyrhizobium sp. AUGA SZCCT0240 TaxID=2807669 RepID=UPI001BA778F4|nr:hypothetical protein [Bradyrhizobium sp. AUGA SZCCT0240]MBR1252268.1 hypothetical protein [Bradyrhizobium sp. AUGA SZCCT0240]